MSKHVAHSPEEIDTSVDVHDPSPVVTDGDCGYFKSASEMI